MQPTRVARRPEPFSHADWVFEIKHDGFRASLFSDKTGVRLISRNGNQFKSFPGLCDGLARDLKGRRCVLDGEIVVLDKHGRSSKTSCSAVLSRTFTLSMCCGIGTPGVTMKLNAVAFGRVRIRGMPLVDRKQRLRAIVPHDAERLLYVSHIAENGEGLFRLACENDLEGIVAKHR